MKKRSGLSLLLAACIGFTAVPCAADMQEQLESKKSDAEENLQELNSQFSALTQEYDALQVRYEDTNYQLRLLEARLDLARGDEAQQREGMRTRIRYMYENSADMSGFGALFASDDFMSFLTAANQMNELTKYDRQMLEQYQGVCTLIQDTQKQVASEQRNVEELKQNTLAKQKEIEALIQSTTEEIEQYSAAIEVEKDRKMQALLQQLQQQAAVAAMLVTTAPEGQAVPAEVYWTETVTGDAVLADAGSWEEIPEILEEADDTDVSAGGYSAGFVPDNSWGGSVLTATAGVNQGPTGRETYYNMEMAGVVDIMRGMGNTDDYWVRDDGVKMLGDYVMVAANLDKYPRGSVVDSSLGEAIVCDTGGFAAYNEDQLDIATAW